MIFCRPGLTTLVAALASAILPYLVQAAELSATDATMAERIEALIPNLEVYATNGMKAFDVPGLAIGIVADDRLVYAKGFGVRSKSGGEPVDARTIFQIGSTTKAFLATSLAILVDRGRLKELTWTVEAIESVANHANGHRWTPEGTVEVPFTPIFPYHLSGAGNINSNIEDLARWVRLQLGHGSFEGHQIVSPGDLAVTHMPRVALSDRLSYAMGWYDLRTPNGTIVWHDGDALSFSAFVGLAPDRNVGVIILTNETNVGFPSALGAWILDRVLGNPEVDYVAIKIVEEKAHFAATAQQFARPANPRPFPPLAPLAGSFVSPSFGKATLVLEGDALVMEILATGAKLKLGPWDGDIFVARLMPTGQFGPIVDLDYMTKGFAQFQMGSDGKLDVLTLTLADGQRYEFRR